MYQLKAHVAEHMLMRSERSLDLLSGLIVMLGWHHYHCVVHAQVNNLVSLASSLAAELGLNRPPSWQERTKLMVVNLGDVKEKTNEHKRLLLAVWYLNSCISMGLQQLEQMAFSPYMERCLSELEEDNDRIHQVYVERSEPYDNTGKAPFSAYVSMFESELETICTQMPSSILACQLIQTHINTIRLRLHEPPRLSAPLLLSISKTLSQGSVSSSTQFFLDSIYQSMAAIKAWYTNWSNVPSSTYYAFPLTIALDLLYAITILGRWAKLVTPSVMHSVREPLPQDPSGSYNDPPNPSTGTTDVNANKPSALDSSGEESGLIDAVATLKAHLVSQPELSIDVTGILSQLICKMEDASAAIVDKSQDAQGAGHNVWSLCAAKLQIAQLKIAQWTEITALNDKYQECRDENIQETTRESRTTTDEEVCQDIRGVHRDPGVLQSDGGLDLHTAWSANATMTGFDGPLGVLDPFLWMDWEEDWRAGMLEQGNMPM
ncbi:hypothetical protein N0V90_009200 [Kalmusia sp. IMI 367209]|nr:hypothetical protein N0V90_009200 [Kalmusia sp. IMI 367209]